MRVLVVLFAMTCPLVVSAQRDVLNSNGVPIRSVEQGSGEPLDDQMIRATVEGVASIVQREYAIADVADRAAAALRIRLTEGQYRKAATPDALAQALTRDLYAATHDKHLAVTVAHPRPSGQTAEQADNAARARAVSRSNAGVRQVEILPGNVGYLDISNFFRPEEARDAIAGAMHLLSHADAVILDMRRNQGGSPGTIALLISYFVDADHVPLFDISHRRDDPTDHYATESVPAADRNATRPLYVLTSARTFSGGEGLAFLLQEQHRAEVVGETTAGAANPGRPYPVNERFDVTVPNGQITSAIKHGNWEGTGVSPDVSTSATSALLTAHERALRKLLETEPPGSWRDTLEGVLRAVETAKRQAGSNAGAAADRQRLRSDRAASLLSRGWESPRWTQLGPDRDVRMSIGGGDAAMAAAIVDEVGTASIVQPDADGMSPAIRGPKRHVRSKIVDVAGKVFQRGPC